MSKFISCLVLLVAALSASAAEKPNILFIFADDWGWGDLSCHGHPYVKTPNIDRLAKEGTDFHRFTVASGVCSPSRTAVMTGQFPARYNIDGHFAWVPSNARRKMPDWLDPKAPLLPRMLQGAGYATAHFGKWHLANNMIPDSPLPSAYGYDAYGAFNYAGEQMPPAKLPGIRAAFDAKISNSYGPTEVNQVTQYTVPLDHRADCAIPIGHALGKANLVLSDHGEMLCSGPMTMIGYWNRPELNEHAFVQLDGKRYYRTGDLAEQRQDGLWMFHGRADRQVKVRGNRIELDEIEAVLAAHPAVSEAAVVTTSSRSSLTAYVTLAPGQYVDAGMLRFHCAEVLPLYAVPSGFNVMGKFARTGTGKIDRRALVEEAS